MLESYSLSFKSEDEIGLLPLSQSISESSRNFYMKCGILTLITTIIGGTLGTAIYFFYIQ
jgi:hypothetical protein